jgi:hypothetical protein
VVGIASVLLAALVVLVLMPAGRIGHRVEATDVDAPTGAGAWPEPAAD